MILHYTGPHWHRITQPNRRSVCASNPNVNQDFVLILNVRFKVYRNAIRCIHNIDTPFVSLQPQNQIVTAFYIHAIQGTHGILEPKWTSDKRSTYYIS